MLTVFTPTYNRATELKRLYASLKAQTSKDFEWLIMDDGSTDNTSAIVQTFLDENVIAIRYFRQENSGKMKAHNRGVESAKGELFVCIDADDWLTQDAVAQITAAAESISKESVCGMMFLDLDGDTDRIVGTPFPWEAAFCTCYDVYNKHGVTGDKTLVFKTSVIADYPFPEIENEKFVPEALVFNRISDKYTLFCINIPIKRVEYLPDGYTSNYFQVCRKNPQGQILYYKELYLKQPSAYNAAAYDMFCIYAGKSLTEAVREHPRPLIALALYLPAYIKYLLKERKT